MALAVLSLRAGIPFEGSDSSVTVELGTGERGRDEADGSLELSCCTGVVTFIEADWGIACYILLMFLLLVSP